MLVSSRRFYDVHILTLIFLWVGISNLSAKETPNSRQARQLFNQAYNMVFGNEGCSLRYDVNIIGVYKTNGTIWMKGKKSKFVESRYSAWCDGVDFFRVDKKKKTVEHHDPDSPNKDKYGGKFKFSPDNYTYSVKATDKDFIITMVAKPGVDGIKRARAVIDKKTRQPKKLKMKVLFFWATVNISDFKNGGINDKVFEFPKASYRDYVMVDKRK